MANERGVASATNLDSYYTKPDNIVDLFENTVARHGSRNLRRSFSSLRIFRLTTAC